MKKIVFLAALFCSFSAVADDVWFTSTIKRVYPLSDGSFVLIFNDPSPNCTNPSTYHYVRAGNNGMTADGVKNILSSSLIAAASLRPVSINFETNTGSCFVNRMQVIFD